MEYLDSFRTLQSQDPVLAAELADVRSLEGVLRWIRERGLPLGSLDLVTQDEFSHDVLLPLPDGRCLAFAVT